MKKTAAILIFISIVLLTPHLLYPSEAQMTRECDSCSDCSNTIQNTDPGDTVRLENNINNSVSCIDFGGTDYVTFDCDGFTISGEGTGSGILLDDSDMVTITNCPNISYFSEGISVSGTGSNTLSDITITGNSRGISITDSGGHSLSRIKSTGNTEYGISLSGSTQNEFSDMNASYNSMGGISLSGGSDDNNFNDVTILGNNDGISLASSSYNFFTNIDSLYNTVNGIFLISGSNSNVFINSDMNDNFNGILIEGSNSNNFTLLSINNNAFSGISINDASEYNMINDSYIEDNTAYGVYLESVTGYPRYNLFYNNYLNNEENMDSDDNQNTNYWNTTLDCSSPNIVDGPCIGGNYWTEPDGSGPSDECTDADSDGICDGGCSSAVGNDDFLPLTIYVDTLSPVLSFVPPTPADGTEFTEQDWIFVNVSSNEDLDSCILDWNGTNESIIPDGKLCYINKAGLANGSLSYTVYASDASGNMGSTEMRNALIDVKLNTFPVIHGYEIYPPVIKAEDIIQISVTASDDEGIVEVKGNITYPNGTRTDAVLNATRAVSWWAPVPGLYEITITVRDSSFNKVNVTGSFTVKEPFDISIEITDSEGEEVSSDLELYSSGTAYVAYRDHESDGKFDLSIAEHDYDVVILAFEDYFEILLSNVHIDPDFDSSISLDSPASAGEFDYVFAVETDYVMDEAVLRIYYNDMNFGNETNANAYYCDDWDFEYQVCDDDWELIEDAVNDEDGEFLEFNVSGFSAFAIREDTYCGDGWCGPGENAGTCHEDCECNEGETRACSANHHGRCSRGTEICSANVWSGCPLPIEESCNMEDDDCDGKIDDVDNGNSVAETRCQCYNDGTPRSEECNGIDDDCDGQIDEGSDCCTPGQTRDCGPSTTQGECRKGTNECVGGVWGKCINAVFPVDEICNDGLDNDCDGEADEDCMLSECGHGAIEERCLCGDTPRSSGYCCYDVYSSGECVEGNSWWWILVLVGIVMLAAVAALFFYFKKQGKELTWEELKKRYASPAA